VEVAPPLVHGKSFEPDLDFGTGASYRCRWISDAGSVRLNASYALRVNPDRHSPIAAKVRISSRRHDQMSESATRRQEHVPTGATRAANRIGCGRSGTRSRSTQAGRRQQYGAITHTAKLKTINTVQAEIGIERKRYPGQASNAARLATPAVTQPLPVSKAPDSREQLADQASRSRPMP